MLTLFAQLPPLRNIVRSAVKNINLAISSVGAHDILLDRLSYSNGFDELIKRRLGGFPFAGGDDLDDAGFHAIRIHFLHL